MCDRRERMKVGVVLVVAAMMIGGMSPPVAAQSKDLNQEIFQKLQNSGALDQLATKLGVSKKQITGVDFMGELRIEAFILEPPDPTTLETEEVNVQEMSAKNCGTVEDTVHLTVTNSKETTHEVSYQHTWGTEIGYSITWGTGVTVEAFGASFESNFEQNFSLAANYAYTRGGSDTTTTSTSWEQGIDVLVPPHQIVPVTFIAKKETADRDFTQVFTAYGKAEIQLADPTSSKFELWVKDAKGTDDPADDEYQYYTETTVVDKFVSLEDRIDKLERKGPSAPDPEFEVYQNYLIRVELYEFPDHTGLYWAWTSSNPGEEAWVPGDIPYVGIHFNLRQMVSSMRIIDLKRPYACIYYDKDYASIERCFNVNQHDPSFVRYSPNQMEVTFDDHVYSVEIPSQFEGQITVTLCSDENYAGVCREYTQSTPNTGAEYGPTFTSIKIESPPAAQAAEHIFLLQEYLPDKADRQFTLTGTYHRVGMMTGWFEKQVATRVEWEDCECDQFGDASPDCEPQFWCDEFPNAAGCGQVDVFSVFIKTRGSGTGTIRLNGVDRGTDFAISYTLDTIPALHKLEAIADEFSTFAGWETATGTPILVDDQPYTPLPGETIYAVFDLQQP